MKIKKKYRNLVFSCLAALFISVPMSFVMVALNFGLRSGFLMAFLKSAFIGTAISVPLANLFIPVAEKIVHHLVEDEES